jgi:hypothetical protein
MKPYQTFTNVRNSRATLFGILALVALLVAAGAVWAEPVPFECTGEAFMVQENPATLYQINKSTSPFTFDPIASFTTQLNNLGYRNGENVLYAMVLNNTGGPLGNSGIVKIDRDGNVFPVATTGVTIPSGIRYNAGDVSVDGSWYYLNVQTMDGITIQGDSTLFIVDLTSGDGSAGSPLTVTSIERQNTTGLGDSLLNIADWAAHPTEKANDGIQPVLYGASYQGNIFRLDPFTGSVTRVGTSAILPGGVQQPGNAYGGTWFDADGRFFAYRNGGPTVGDRPGEIYEVDLAGQMVLSAQFGGPSSTFNDAAACAAEPEEEPDNPAIEIEKTVYEGHDSGNSAPGGDIFEGMLDDQITYLFTVTNTGNVALTLSTFEDTVLRDSEGNPIDGSDLTPALDGQVLQPGESKVFYYETAIDDEVDPWSTAQGSLLNEACVDGTAPDQTPVSDCDDAAVLVPELCEDPGDPSDGEGCTPGYWKVKQHHDSWVDYTSSDSFETIFQVEIGDDITLLQALKIRDPWGEGALKRHAVAALLNASSSVDYLYTEAEVIEWVRMAYTNGDFELHKDHLEMENQRMCPLD